jgi:hypothetical protein
LRLGGKRSIADAKRLLFHQLQPRDGGLKAE